jgi:predicted kinase
MLKNISIILTLIICLKINSGNCIIVMGPSCAGKSTYCNKYRQQYNDNLEFIEFDEIEKDLEKKINAHVSEQEIMKKLLDQGQRSLNEGKDILIDTNYYEDSLLNLNAARIKRILIFAPLNTLFKRNRERAKALYRTFERDLRCANYIYKTYLKFKQIKELKKYEEIIEN